MTKSDSDTVNEIQINDPHSNMMMGKDNDSLGWRSLPGILEFSDKDTTCNFDDDECLFQDFHKKEHIISNIQNVKLKLIIALFETGAISLCILYHLFHKISDKVNMTKMSLQVNTASGTTVDPIGIDPLIFGINDHMFINNFIICKTLKHPLTIGLDFAQWYRIGVGQDAYGTLFLIYKGKKITTIMRKDNQCQPLVALLDIPVANTYAGYERKCSFTNRTITIPPYHVSMISLIPVRQPILLPNTLIGIDKSPFLLKEQHSISILPLLQKVGDRLPDEFITVLWNHGDHTVTLKKIPLLVM